MYFYYIDVIIIFCAMCALQSMCSEKFKVEHLKYIVFVSILHPLYIVVFTFNGFIDVRNWIIEKCEEE